MVDVPCPHCGLVYHTAGANVGKHILCTKCGVGVTILSTVEVNESFTEFPFSTYSISFLPDYIIRLRYICIDGQLRKIMVVIKMRGGNHSKAIREYEIASEGVVIIGEVSCPLALVRVSERTRV